MTIPRPYPSGSRSKCRRLKAQNDIELIIIDYLQLMTGDASRTGGGNREQEIASISRALKNIAKELSVPVIALSQLSRAVETRVGDKPSTVGFENDCARAMRWCSTPKRVSGHGLLS